MMQNINEKRLSIIYRAKQPELKEFLTTELKSTHDEIVNNDGFIFAKGTIPILLVAHMDTVHKEPVKEVYSDGNIMSSPQGIGGDDRNGIYSVLEICKTHHCSVLFTEDEEIGGIGAGKFIETELCKCLKEKFNYIIELDRRGNNDAVFYECGNPEFTTFITKEFWKENYGSYSDICTIAPVLGCAAVNLSTAYYNAHTTDEYVVLSELDTIINEVRKLIDRTNFEKDKFKFIELTYERDVYGWFDSYGMYGRKHNDIYTENIYAIEFNDENCNYDTTEIYAENEFEALGQFLFDRPTLCYNNIIDIYEI